MTQTIIDCPMSEIFADAEFNCRGKIAPFDVIDLVKDIEQTAQTVPSCPSGLMSPIQIHPLTPEEQARTGKKYGIIAGFRRHMSFIVLKRDTIPAIILDGLNEFQKRSLNLKENLKRKDLNIMQEAMQLKHFKLLGFTEQQVMTALDATRGWVQVRWMLLELPEEIQDEAAKGMLTQSHIRDLYTIKDNEKRFQAVKDIKDRKERGVKKVAVRINTEKSRKVIRNKTDMISAQDHIYNAIGNNAFTRTLAWCAGEISDIDFHTSIKEYADANGLNYAIPAYEGGVE